MPYDFLAYDSPGRSCSHFQGSGIQTGIQSIAFQQKIIAPFLLPQTGPCQQVCMAPFSSPELAHFKLASTSLRTLATT